MTDSPAPQLANITTARMQFRCRVQGDPDGLPLLLLHGSYATSRWWEYLLQILPTAFHVVAPDLRGCGGSTKSESGYTFEEQAEDVRALVDELGWHDFDLVAHSSSAAIALEFALQQQVRLSKLVLISPTPVEGIYTPVDALVVMEELQQNETLLRTALASLMPAFMPVGHESIIPEHHAQFFNQLVEDIKVMAPAAFTATAVALNQWNRFREAQQISLPTLLVWGDADPLVDQDTVTRTLIAIPGASNLQIIRGIGHCPMLEAPIALAETLMEFLTDDFDEFAEIRSSV
jgi:pimeloyl-ACP methyl ester carboxylesterase